MSIKVIGNFTPDKVFEFFVSAQIVNGNSAGNTALVKRFNDVTASKAGRTYYDNGHNKLPLSWFFRRPWSNHTV